MRRLLLLFLLTALVGCSAAEPPRVESVEVESVWEDMATNEEYPSSVIVKVTLRNPSAAVKLLSGRARIGYGGKWVAMLTLTEKVKIPARGSAVVELPLRLNVQRTAQTMQLRAALKGRRTEGIMIDWQVALRTRMAYVEREQGPMSIEEMAGQNIGQLQEILKDIFEE